MPRLWAKWTALHTLDERAKVPLERIGHGEAPHDLARIVDELGPGEPLDPLHHDDGGACGIDADVVHRDDVRMLERAGHPRFAQDADRWRPRRSPPSEASSPRRGARASPASRGGRSPIPPSPSVACRSIRPPSVAPRARSAWRAAIAPEEGGCGSIVALGRSTRVFAISGSASMRAASVAAKLGSSIGTPS